MKLLVIFISLVSLVFTANAQVQNNDLKAEEPKVKIKTRSYSQRAMGAGTAAGVMYFASTTSILVAQHADIDKNSREMLVVCSTVFALSAAVLQIQSWRLYRKSVLKRQELELKAKSNEVGLVFRF